MSAAEQLVPAFAQGLARDLPSETYHAIEAMSSSGAKKILRSPAHYRLMRTTPSVPTDAMQFGTVVHTGVLEPHALAARVAIAPSVNKRTNAGKEQLAEFEKANAGKIVLAEADYLRARRCIDNVLAHPGAARLLDGAEFELSMFWNDGQYGVPCKCRWDARNHGGAIDLKTTTDASPDGFSRTIASFDYHVQAAHYISGGEHVLDRTPQFFAFIAVESEPPHLVACYVLPGAAVMAGAHRMNEALARYRAALDANAWPGYPDTIEPINLPRWAMRFDN